MEEHDKQKFIAWLSRQINDRELLLTQVVKLGATSKAIEQSLSREKAGLYIVRGLLQSTESISIGPG